MRILLHEFISGGGAWSVGQAPPSGSLLVEGEAMLSALVEDLAKVDGVALVVFRDRRLESIANRSNLQVVLISGHREERDALQRWSPRVDGVILVAPELNGYLHERACLVERAGGRLLSPGSSFVQLAADKFQTNHRLSSHGVAVPTCAAVRNSSRLPKDFPYPAILKPRDGAGSTGIQRVPHHDSSWTAPRGDWCLESYQQGTDASVAVLLGPRISFALPACYQHLDREAGFRYLGASAPLAPQLAYRAHRLALDAIRAMPGTVGYVGVDLILGAAADASQDRVIEINPRLTTSYVALRQFTSSNLAEAMLAVAHGEQPELFLTREPVEFMLGPRPNSPANGP